jgi:uncharacterized protein (TIGR03083 family)
MVRRLSVRRDSLSRMAEAVNFHDHLVADSARFAAAAGQAAPDTPVPSCPLWNADDLLWHLGQVQYFWGTVVLDQVDGDEAQKRTPERPGDRAGLVEFGRRAADRLTGALTGLGPAEQRWTWQEDDQTIGFILRRQAHEALIHRVDAELTAGDRTPLDPALAGDGVDEALRVMYGGCPSWGTITPEPGRTLRLRATDTGRSWLVTLARFSGTEPDGTSHTAEPDIHVAAADPGGPALAEISGTAADLDCWVWHRPPFGQVERSGDAEVLAGFDGAIAPAIN